MIIALVLAGAESASHAGPQINWLAVFTFLRGAASVTAILAGLFFVLGGAIGVLRLPDFYTRLHAAGITDTLGAELIIVGLIIQSGFSQTSLKLALVAVFLLFTSPTATHAVAYAAHKAGLKPYLGPYRAPDPSASEEA